MRQGWILAAFVVASPLAAQGNDALASLRTDQQAPDSTFSAYRVTPYRAVRRGEVESASFLTEGRAIAFGKVLGPVDPSDVHASLTGALSTEFTEIAVLPPDGAAYATGDTVLLAQVAPGALGWGQVVLPTGLAVIGEHTPRQTLARVVAVYRPIRGGQVSLPLESIPPTPAGAPAAVSGPTGAVILSEEPRELQQTASLVFVNMGRAAGIRLGDFVQFRRRPAPRENAADAIDDLMAVGEVVHLGDRSCTVKLTRIVDPDIRPGTPVVRIASLP